jgi:hypothetical protein
LGRSKCTISARSAGRPVLSAVRRPTSVDTSTCAFARSAPHIRDQFRLPLFNSTCSARSAGKPVLSATRRPTSVDTSTCAFARSAPHIRDHFHLPLFNSTCSARSAGKPVLSATRSPASADTSTCAFARPAPHTIASKPGSTRAADAPFWYVKDHVPPLPEFSVATMQHSTAWTRTGDTFIARTYRAAQQLNKSQGGKSRGRKSPLGLSAEALPSVAVSFLFSASLLLVSLLCTAKTLMHCCDADVSPTQDEHIWLIILACPATFQSCIIFMLGQCSPAFCSLLLM